MFKEDKTKTKDFRNAERTNQIPLRDKIRFTHGIITLPDHLHLLQLISSPSHVVTFNVPFPYVPRTRHLHPSQGCRVETGLLMGRKRTIRNDFVHSVAVISSPHLACHPQSPHPPHLVTPTPHFSVPVRPEKWFRRDIYLLRPRTNGQSGDGVSLVVSLVGSRTNGRFQCHRAGPCLSPLAHLSVCLVIQPRAEAIRVRIMKFGISITGIWLNFCRKPGQTTNEWHVIVEYNLMLSPKFPSVRPATRTTETELWIIFGMTDNGRRSRSSNWNRNSGSWHNNWA